MRVTPLNWPRNWMSQLRSSFGGWAEGDGAGVLGGECVEKPGDEDSGMGGALGIVEQLAKKALELLDRDGSEQFEAEGPGFFHIEWVYSHGEPDGVKDHSYPSDYGGEALALVCVNYI